MVHMRLIAERGNREGIVLDSTRTVSHTKRAYVAVLVEWKDGTRQWVERSLLKFKRADDETQLHG